MLGFGLDSGCLCTTRHNYAEIPEGIISDVCISALLMAGMIQAVCLVKHSIEPITFANSRIKVVVAQKQMEHRRPQRTRTMR